MLLCLFELPSPQEAEAEHEVCPHVVDLQCAAVRLAGERLGRLGRHESLEAICLLHAQVQEIEHLDRPTVLRHQGLELSDERRKLVRLVLEVVEPGSGELDRHQALPPLVAAAGSRAQDLFSRLVRLERLCRSALEPKRSAKRFLQPGQLEWPRAKLDGSPDEAL